MPLQQTSGAASYDAFGGGAPIAAKYIEDFFQTWLRTGTGSSTTVTTGLNASINKSLVWTKSRSAATNHKLTDNVRGATKALSSNTTGAEVTDSQGLTAFSSTGYTIGTNTDYNNSGATYVDFQWVATPKFFDVVTYTGNGVAGRTVAHNLGSVPGCIIIKRTDSTSDWGVMSRQDGGAPDTYFTGLKLNATNANTGVFSFAGDNTSTTFSTNVDPVGGSTSFNVNGATYVAYLFAHNAGGFGLTGTDNVISCGSFTTDGSGNATVNLGYEPQWVLYKRSSTTGGWDIVDNMRGMPVSGSTPKLVANTANAETTGGGEVRPTATGFITDNFQAAASTTYIYIAIRRGPMRTPTSGTSVFHPFARAGNDTQTDITGVGFTPDLWMVKSRNIAADFPFFDRLRGVTRRVVSNSTNAEETFSGSNGLVSLNMNGITIGAGAVDGGICNDTGTNYGNWLLKRAPGFFDEVCYTGNGASARSITHNLGVTPELIITKDRSAAINWYVLNTFASAVLKLNLTDANNTGLPAFTYGNGTSYIAPTSSVFTVNVGAAQSLSLNWSGDNYVSYLFASCPGVSKVGSYTGTGTTQTINCGFTAGSRFVMIKRTDSTGDWYVWDSARGIVAGNDPYLLLNSNAAEVTSTDFVDTAATGFELSSTAPAALNANGGTYIFLAIA